MEATQQRINASVFSSTGKVSEANDFFIEESKAEHILYLNEICKETLLSAKARGTGISGRPPELLSEKIKKVKLLLHLQKMENGQVLLLYLHGKMAVMFQILD
ncbi:hypothetical protein ACQ9BO_14315 [Flavobacterium sp. P21]|uniref:hypothetical protein n=1 Tax=Flavobacterium sp. P21 TaxID=3423948 RepID=UPI003D674ABE